MPQLAERHRAARADLAVLVTEKAQQQLNARTRTNRGPQALGEACHRLTLLLLRPSRLPTWELLRESAPTRRKRLGDVHVWELGEVEVPAHSPVPWRERSQIEVWVGPGLLDPGQPGPSGDVEPLAHAASDRQDNERLAHSRRDVSTFTTTPSRSWTRASTVTTGESPHGITPKRAVRQPWSRARSW